MNHVYKVVRCNTTGVFKAVPENAKSGKKSKSVSLASAVITTVSTPLSFYKKPLTIALAVLGFSALSIVPAQADYGDDSRRMINEMQFKIEEKNIELGDTATATAAKNDYFFSPTLISQVGSIAIGNQSGAAQYIRDAEDTGYDDRLEAEIAKMAARYKITPQEYKETYYGDGALFGQATYLKLNAASQYAESIAKTNTAIGANTLTSSGGTAIGSGAISHERDTVSFGNDAYTYTDYSQLITFEPILDENGDQAVDEYGLPAFNTEYYTENRPAVTRRLVNVSDGIDATDVATIGQLQTAVRDLGSSEMFTETIADKADKTYADSENAKQDTAINTATTTNNTQNTAIQTNKNNIAT
ncbi:ESPR-type extended signal peptide-containing protein, partial [uncultured Psychrobacter sp.]